MNALILSFYFEPDLSAGSFRNTAFVNELVKLGGESLNVDVLTTLPNRYSSYNVSSKEKESIKQLSITRFRIPKHQNSILSQAISFGYYFHNCLFFVKDKRYNIIYASSSRLFTAFLGAIIANRKKVPLFLDIRDLLVENMEELIPNKFIKFFFIPILKRIESYTINSAMILNINSFGFRGYFNKYNGVITNYTNGIDDEFLLINSNENSIQNNKIILYAGNIGEGQGLDKIIPQLAELLPDYIFIIIGDGGTKKKLENNVIEKNLKNVQLIPPLSRRELIEYYQKASFLFLHLNTYKAFERVLPSKIFEYGALNKPIIAGVSGYARKFITEEVNNSLVFNPCDAVELVKLLNSYNYYCSERTEFNKKFRRENIISQMATKFLSMALNNV